MIAAYNKVAEHLEFRRDNAQRTYERASANAENGLRRAEVIESHARTTEDKLDPKLVRALAQIRRSADANSTLASGASARAMRFSEAAELLRKTVEGVEREGLVWVSQ